MLGERKSDYDHIDWSEFFPHLKILKLLSTLQTLSWIMRNKTSPGSSVCHNEKHVYIACYLWLFQVRCETSCNMAFQYRQSQYLCFMKFLQNSSSVLNWNINVNDFLFWRSISTHLSTTMHCFPFSLFCLIGRVDMSLSNN